jgi:hypothetical protein
MLSVAYEGDPRGRPQTSFPFRRPLAWTSATPERALPASPPRAPPPNTAVACRDLYSGRRCRGLLAVRWLQRKRFLAIAIMFVVAVPVAGSMLFASLTSQAALLTATFFAGFLGLGIQSGINVVGAMIYPTSLRLSDRASVMSTALRSLKSCSRQREAQRGGVNTLNTDPPNRVEKAGNSVDRPTVVACHADPVTP